MPTDTWRATSPAQMWQAMGMRGHHVMCVEPWLHSLRVCAPIWQMYFRTMGQTSHCTFCSSSGLVPASEFLQTWHPHWSLLPREPEDSYLLSC